jgi:hypothetical protein
MKSFKIQISKSKCQMNVKVQDQKCFWHLNFGFDLKFELWYSTFKSSDLFRMLATSTIQKEIRMTVGSHLG